MRCSAARLIVPVVTVLFSVPVLAEPPLVSISGQIRGASGKHSIYVALWDAEGFMKKPVERIQIKVGDAAAFHFDTKPGRYAISAFEDRNDNGVLDIGVFGPKEPAGFYRSFSGWRRPTFDDVAFALSAPLEGADVVVK